MIRLTSCTRLQNGGNGILPSIFSQCDNKVVPVSSGPIGILPPRGGFINPSLPRFHFHLPALGERSVGYFRRGRISLSKGSGVSKNTNCPIAPGARATQKQNQYHRNHSSPLAIRVADAYSAPRAVSHAQEISISHITGAARARRPSGRGFLWSGVSRAPSGAPFPVSGNANRGTSDHQAVSIGRDRTSLQELRP